MDRLQNQIIDLNQKVDGIYQTIENLSNQISEFVQDKQAQSLEKNEKFPSTLPMRQVERRNKNSNELLMAHKDIINDDSSWESHSDYDSENNLAPEIQIRRLTAQLTAAYNRIAALEEQLLARRTRV